MPFDEEGCNEKEGRVEHEQGMHNCVYLIAMSCFLHQHFHVSHIYTSKIQLLIIIYKLIKILEAG